MATGSSANKRTLNNMLNSVQAIKRISPVSGSATEIEEYENVVYVTLPATGEGLINLPEPAECKGQTFLIYVEDEETSTGGGEALVRYHKGNGLPALLVDAVGVANSAAADFTAIGDRIYVVSDGERYHVFTYTVS